MNKIFDDIYKNNKTIIVLVGIVLVIFIGVKVGNALSAATLVEVEPIVKEDLDTFTTSSKLVYVECHDSVTYYKDTTFVMYDPNTSQPMECVE